jgi:hypothetical protein
VRATPETHSTRGDLAWAYIIDPATRELRVYHEGAVASADAPKLFGTWGRVAMHAIQADGSCTPPEITVTLPEPWPRLRVDPTWNPAEGLSLGAEREQRDSDAEATAPRDLPRPRARLRGGEPGPRALAPGPRSAR